MLIALSRLVAFPVSLADSTAAVTSTRATTARRISSADGPSSLTNAVTSHEESRMRAPPTLTVVIDLPREGGVAISCSQICSMPDSKSSAAAGSDAAVAAGALRSFDFALPPGVTDSAPVFLAPGADRKEVPAAPREAFSGCFPKAFSSACSTSVRRPSSLSNAWLTVRSVYSFWKGCFHSSAITRILLSGSAADNPK